MQKNYQCPCPCCKIVIKIENMINEDKWKISTNQKMWKIDFDECLKYFSVRPPMKKIKNQKLWKNQFLFMFNFLKWDPFLLKKYNFLAQMLRTLLSNKNGIFHFWKVNNSIATKMCTNLLNNCLKIEIFFSTWYNSITKMWRALFKYEKKKWVEKLMYNFVACSNDIPYWKRWHIGLDHVFVCEDLFKYSLTSNHVMYHHWAWSAIHVQIFVCYQF